MTTFAGTIYTGPEDGLRVACASPRLIRAVPSCGRSVGWDQQAYEFFPRYDSKETDEVRYGVWVPAEQAAYWRARGKVL